MKFPYDTLSQYSFEANYKSVLVQPQPLASNQR